MPGVLQVEAMAQVGGLLVLNSFIIANVYIHAYPFATFSLDTALDSAVSPANLRS